MTDNKRRTVAKVARQLVVELIMWELNAADGEGYDHACEEFGYERVREALLAIVDDLERKGVADVRTDE